jgi:hypothetical protein
MSINRRVGGYSPSIEISVAGPVLGNQRRGPAAGTKTAERPRGAGPEYGPDTRDRCSNYLQAQAVSAVGAHLQPRGHTCNSATTCLANATPERVVGRSRFEGIADPASRVVHPVDLDEQTAVLPKSRLTV